MWKPGERQARPTSWNEAESLELMGPEGRAVRAPEEWTMLELVDRSSRRGRCREVVMSGDEGSFFTTILGAGWPRDLLDEVRLEMASRLGGDMEEEEAQVVGLEEAGRKEEEREWTLKDVRKR